MMPTLFLICATIGGTILIGQFVLALVGFGGHGDFDGDVPHDFGGDMPHDLHVDAHDAHSPDHELGEHGVGHGNLSAWLFGVLSFKTVTAALAFFGLAGCAANAAQMGTGAQLVIASGAGFAAMHGVHWLMRSIRRLSEDGTQRIERSLGKEGTVYLTIPAQRKGTGKVQFKLQNRLVQYEAITAHDDPLPTGSKVQIVGMAGKTVLEVEPWVEPKPSAA
jgi:membrane protein implicated in regulation of membrane protease activity